MRFAAPKKMVPLENHHGLTCANAHNLKKAVRKSFKKTASVARKCGPQTDRALPITFPYGHKVGFKVWGSEFSL